MTVKQAAARLGISVWYVYDLCKALGIQLSNGSGVSLADAQVEAIGAERERRRRQGDDADRARLKAVASQGGRARGMQKRRRALELGCDHYGVPVAFAFDPAIVQDESLSSPNYGPAMATIQFRPFYPALDGELNEWSNVTNDWMPRRLTAAMLALDRHAVRLWQESRRNR